MGRGALRLRARSRHQPCRGPACRAWAALSGAPRASRTRALHGGRERRGSRGWVGGGGQAALLECRRAGIDRAASCEQRGSIDSPSRSASATLYLPRIARSWLFSASSEPAAACGSACEQPHSASSGSTRERGEQVTRHTSQPPVAAAGRRQIGDGQRGAHLRCLRAGLGQQLAHQPLVLLQPEGEPPNRGRQVTRQRRCSGGDAAAAAAAGAAASSCR